MNIPLIFIPSSPAHQAEPGSEGPNSVEMAGEGSNTPARPDA